MWQKQLVMPAAGHDMQHDAQSCQSTWPRPAQYQAAASHREQREEGHGRPTFATGHESDAL